MKTIVLERPGELAAIDAAPPGPPGPGEALVRVRKIGVCGTDLHAYRGRQPFFTYPRILGHELGVEVAELGAGVTDLAVGDRCAVEPYLECGRCIACRRGRPNCCTRLEVLGVHVDGGMRELICIPARKLHKSARLSLEQLALVETLGIGAHAVDRAQLTPGERVLVVGAGPIGLAVIEFARLAGATVMVLDVRADRLEFCRRLGVEHCLLAGEGNVARLEEWTGGDLPTVVFEATGNPQSMQQAFHYASHAGKLVLVSIVQGDISFPDPLFHRRELTLLSSRNSTAADFRRILQLLESGQIDSGPWITHRAALADVPRQFPGWLLPERGVVKAMVEV